MRVLRAVLYGYLGAVLGGVVVAVIGLALGHSQEAIAAASVPTGVVFGMLGLSLMWWRPLAQRLRLEAARPKRSDRDHPRG